jgi:hypothetical protein
VGTLALDTARDQVGEVRGHVGPYVQLRPEDGGLEWDARPENVRPLSAGESLAARVAAANRRSRWSPRAIMKAAEWTLTAETAEGAPSGIFSAACVACGGESPAVDDDRLPVEVWALKHTGLNPAHRQFQLRVLAFWRVDPAPGNPHHAQRNDGTSHASPRGAERFTGPQADEWT